MKLWHCCCKLNAGTLQDNISNAAAKVAQLSDATGALVQSLSSAFHSANNSKQSRRGASCQLSSLVNASINAFSCTHVILHRSHGLFL